MKALKAVLAGLAILLLVAGGGMLLAHNFRFIDLTETVFGPGGEIWVGFAGIVMLLAGLFSLYAVVSGMRPGKYFSVHNPGGEIRISHAAIEDMLRKPTSSIEGVENIVPRAGEGKKGLEILNWVAVSEGTSIPRVAGQLQDIIRSKAKDELGIEELGAIRTYVYRISSGYGQGRSGKNTGEEDS